MGAAIFNIVVGIVLLVGALKFDMALIGTSSTTAMAVVAGIILGIGIFQLIRIRSGR